jgi:hypothetical protein
MNVLLYRYVSGNIWAGKPDKLSIGQETSNMAVSLLRWTWIDHHATCGHIRLAADGNQWHFAEPRSHVGALTGGYTIFFFLEGSSSQAQSCSESVVGVHSASLQLDDSLVYAPPSRYPQL